MADRGWKAFERRMSRDGGTERIPVTGERDGADAALPAWLFAWLNGITATAERTGKIGVLVPTLPRVRAA